MTVFVAQDSETCDKLAGSCEIVWENLEILTSCTGIVDERLPVGLCTDVLGMYEN